MNARLRHLRHSFFRQWRKWRKNRFAPLILPIVQWRNGAAKKQWRKKPENCAIQNLLFKLLAFRAESLTSKKKEVGSLKLSPMPSLPRAIAPWAPYGLPKAQRRWGAHDRHPCQIPNPDPRGDQ